MTRLSCSSRVATRRGSPSRRPIADAATASGGATTAPSASAAASATPGSSSQVTQPTTTVVKTTSTTDIDTMLSLLCLKSNSEVRAVVAYSSGGSSTYRTRSGSSRISGTRGRNDAAAPTTTSTSGVGQPEPVAQPGDDADGDHQGHQLGDHLHGGDDLMDVDSPSAVPRPQCRCRIQSAGTRPAGPGTGWPAGCSVGAASSGPSAYSPAA